MMNRADRPSIREARNAARHIAESWAIEAAQQRRLATEYAGHLAWLGDELRTLQRAEGLPEHACPICEQASGPAAKEGT